MSLNLILCYEIFCKLVTVFSGICILALIVKHRFFLYNSIPNLSSFKTINKGLIFSLLTTVIGFSHIKGIFIFVKEYGHGVFIFYLLFLIPVYFGKLLELETNFSAAINENNDSIFPVLHELCTYTKSIFYLLFILTGLDILPMRVISESFISNQSLIYMTTLSSYLLITIFVSIVLACTFSSWSTNRAISFVLTFAVLSSCFIFIIFGIKNVVIFINNISMRIDFSKLLSQIYSGLFLALYSNDLFSGFLAYNIGLQKTQYNLTKISNKKDEIKASVTYSVFISFICILLAYLSIISSKIMPNSLFDLYKIHFGISNKIFEIIFYSLLQMPCLISSRIIIEAIFQKMNINKNIVKILSISLWILILNTINKDINFICEIVFLIYSLQLLINIFATNKYLNKIKKTS